LDVNCWLKYSFFLKKELDNMEGGRRVTRADVKAWLKNRF
jgi:hypothetical protein